MNPRKPNPALPNSGNGGVRAGRGALGARPGAVAVPARPSAAHQLDQLADAIEKFKVDFERFLAGATLIPPEEQRMKLVRDLRELRGANLRASAEQFRLASLEARFNSYTELFNRRLRDREEGRGVRHARHARPADEARRQLDAATGVVVTDRLEPDAVEALYQGLARRSGSGGSPAMEPAAFRGYLAQQIESIRLKTGCDAVQFRIATEDGKLKLKAKPVSQ